jgi:tRNA modification GTPase
VIQVWNKFDIAPGREEQANVINISAKTGQGIDRLKALIRDAVGLRETQEGSFSARTRHLDALRRTRAHLQTGEEQLKLNNAPEMLAEELRLAQKSLGEITGEFLPDDLLGAIFASFCIGK